MSLECFLFTLSAEREFGNLGKENMWTMRRSIKTRKKCVLRLQSFLDIFLKIKRAFQDMPSLGKVRERMFAFPTPLLND